MIDKIKNIPRVFDCGDSKRTKISDYGEIHLDDRELVSFVMETGQKYDIVRKFWGFHATPSINHRLINEGFKTALVKNQLDRLSIVLVSIQRLGEFQHFCEEYGTEVLTWLDELPAGNS